MAERVEGEYGAEQIQVLDGLEPEFVRRRMRRGFTTSCTKWWTTP